MEKQEIITGLEQGLTRLQAIARLDPKVLQKAYAPGKWTGTQVFSHLADTDLVMYVRFMRIISEDSVRIVPFDQDKWVLQLEGDKRPLDLSLSAMESTRKGFLYYLQTLSDEALSRKAYHPERGEVTALFIAERACVHGLHHLQQLEAIRDGKEWKPGTST